MRVWLCWRSPAYTRSFVALTFVRDTELYLSWLRLPRILLLPRGFRVNQRVNVLMGLEETPATILRFVGPPGRPQVEVRLEGGPHAGEVVRVPLGALS